MSTNTSNNNNGKKNKAGWISLIVLAIAVIAGIAFTGNANTFLPLINGDGYTAEADYSSDTESIIADSSSVPEQTTAATEATTASAAESTAATEQSTTAPAETTPAEQPVEIVYSFRNKSTYDSHYEKHGDEFGSITQEQYLQLANELIFSDADTVLTKYADDGDFMYFDTATGYFLVLSPDDYIRTFFVPDDGIDYWNRQ